MSEGRYREASHLTDHMPRGSNVCRQCYCPQLTWAEQCQQFGRLIYAGYSREQIKQLMPRCSSCVSEMLGAAGMPQGRPRLARLRGVILAPVRTDCTGSIEAP